MNEKIDFVMTWVNGNDLKWQEEINKYSNNKLDTNEVRFRDWDNLKYWFRGVEKYAPWVNKIYFITEGHLPEWLNLNNEKLVIIKHSDYIPKEYLPTFSSHTIELNIHRIQNLSNNFIYFNDDLFIIDKLEKSDFFYKNKIKDICILQKSTDSDNTFNSILNNNMEFTENHFDIKQDFCNHFFKYVNLKYGKQNLRALTLLRRGNVNFYNVHGANPYFKKTFFNIWNLDEKLLDQTCSHKFRKETDVNQYIMKYYQFLNDNIVPTKKIQKAYNIASDLSLIKRDILNKKYKIVCLNDNEEIKNFEETKNKINAILQELFPCKSKFEK